MSHLERRLRLGIGLILVTVAISTVLGDDKTKEGGPKKAVTRPTKEGAKELQAAVTLLNANQIDKGIEKLQAIVDKYPKGDGARAQAEKLLVEYGVGKDIRLTLIERKVFRQSFKIPEAEVLALVEKTIEELEPYFKKVKPFFETRQLKLKFFDSQASYRKAGGLVTADGHFSMVKADFKARALVGEISWHMPKHAATLKDRQLSLKSILYHETAHYWVAYCFGGAMPSVLDEGIATYLQSRLQQEYYQYYRTTDRLEIESDARHALNTINKHEDFVAFLKGERGFGQGGEMISRWYGLCYAVCDFFEEGTLGGKKSTFSALLEKIEGIVSASVIKTRAGEQPGRVEAKEILETVVVELYGANLEAFHKALTQHILGKYKQR